MAPALSGPDRVVAVARLERPETEVVAAAAAAGRQGPFVLDGTGNPAAAAAAAAWAAAPVSGGAAAGGSFGIYLYNSVLIGEAISIAAGNGGFGAPGATVGSAGPRHRQ